MTSNTEHDPFGVIGAVPDKRSVPFPAYMAKVKTTDPRFLIDGEPNPDIVKAPVVCKAFKISWYSLKKMCDARQFPHIRIGRFYLFEQSKINDLFERNLVS